MRLRESTGATLVELAIVLPLFMLLVLGTIDMGRYMAATASVTTAARESARYGSSVGGEASEHYLDCSGIIDAGMGFGTGIAIQRGDFEITYDSGPGTTSDKDCPDGGPGPSGITAGDRVIVKVTRPFSMVSPLVGAFFGDIEIISIDRRTLLSS